MSAKILRPPLLVTAILAAALPTQPLRAARPRPRVVEIKLDMMIHQVSAEYVERGIRYANEQNADAILLELTLHNAMEQHLANASPQQHIDAHLAEGKKLLAENRYGEAERELAEVVSLSPADPQPHILLAQALEAEGKHHEAVGELQNSLKLKDTVEAHLSLAHVYLSMNQPEMARLQGQAALHLDPGNRQAAEFLEQIHAGAPAARKTP